MFPKVPIKLYITALSILICIFRQAGAEVFLPFKAEVIKDSINVRSDATVSSEIVCTVEKGAYLEVTAETYDWYKVKLPKYAPSFIKDNLVSPMEVKPNRVIKDRVNIRLRPNESSPILSKANKDEIIWIISADNGWYKIEPLDNSFGWANKIFLNKVILPKETAQSKFTQTGKEEQAASKKVPPPPVDAITIEGIIKPQGKFFNRIGTHKLVTQENQIFLLKGDKKNLDSLNYRKLKVSGRLVGTGKQKYQIIEITRIEAID